MSDNHIGIYLDLFGGDKAQRDLKAVGQGLSGLGPASQAGARMATQQLGSMQMSAKQTAAALRGVPAQFTDIVVSLSSGQQPLTVLLQQGGQLKDMFGGVGAAARALGGYVVGLISPLTLLAGGIAAVGVAYYQGSKEQDAYNKALIMTGNRAGTTAAALEQMASLLGKKGYSQSGAADALAELAGTGRIGAAELEKFAAVALDLEKRVGVPVKNTVNDLAELGKAPVDASIKLNEQYGYLTTATLAQIKALQDQGRQDDAAAVAQQAYASAMGQRADEMAQHLGRMERAWNAVKSAAVGAWNAMVNVVNGREVDPRVKQLESLQAQLAAREGQAATQGGDPAWAKGNAKLNSQINALKEALNLDKARAAQEAKDRAIQDAGISAYKEVAALSERSRSKQEQLNDALEVYRQRLTKIREARTNEKDPQLAAKLDAELSPAQIAKNEAAIRKQFADKSGAGRGAQAIQTAGRRLDLSELQNAMRQEQAMIGQQQQQLEISRAAGLLSLEDYYAQKRALIEKNSTVEESAIKQQIERLESEKTKGADAINVQKQLTDLRGKLAVRQIQTQNELADADQKSAKALQQHSAAMAQLTTNTAAYIQQLQARADLQVAGVGMGQQRNQYESGLLSIRENYAQKIRGLEDQRGTAATWTAENEAYFQERVRLLKQQQEEEVRIHSETFDRVTAAQGLWQNGAIRAMEDYLSSTRNVAQQTADAFANGFQNMEDALVTFVTTGKLSFTNFANSVVADITRIIIKQQMSNALGAGGGGGGIMGLLGAGISMFGGSSALASVASTMPGDSLDNFISLKGLAGGRAKGGLVDKGSLYEVNEQGPELLSVGGRDYLMMGQQSGRVTPNDQLGRGGDSSTVIHVNVTAPQGGGSRETALQFGRTVGRQIQVAQARNG